MKFVPHPGDAAVLIYLGGVIDALRDPALLTPEDDLKNRQLAADLLEAYGAQHALQEHEQ